MAAVPTGDEVEESEEPGGAAAAPTGDDGEKSEEPSNLAAAPTGDEVEESEEPSSAATAPTGDDGGDSEEPQLGTLLDFYKDGNITVPSSICIGGVINECDPRCPYTWSFGLERELAYSEFYVTMKKVGKILFPYSASTLLEKKKNARIDPRTVAKLNFDLKKFVGPQKLPTITATVLRGVLDDKVTKKDAEGSGTVVQESGRPTVVAETPTHKRKSSLPKLKKNSACTTLQQSVPVIDVEETEPTTKRPRASVTRAEETTPTSQRAQPQNSQFETELAVLKAKSEASKALHDAQVELAKQTETVKRLEDLRERDDAARDESIRDRIRQESVRDAYESKLATAQKATLEAVMRSHKEAQIREDAERKETTKALADSNRGALAIAERVNAQHFEHTLALQSGKAVIAQAPAVSKEDGFKVFLDRIGYTGHFDLLWNAGVKSAKAITALPEKHLMDLGLTNIEVYLLKNEATEE